MTTQRSRPAGFRAALVTAAVVAAVTLGSCGGEGDGAGGVEPRSTSSTSPPAGEPTNPPSGSPSDTPTGSPSPTGPPGPTAEPPPEPPAEPPSPPTAEPPSEIGVLVGVPEAGVEEGCLVLDGYLLLGGPADVLTAGREVRITGHVEKDLMTTCQQGIPYRVETAEFT